MNRLRIPDENLFRDVPEFPSQAASAVSRLVERAARRQPAGAGLTGGLTPRRSPVKAL